MHLRLSLLLCTMVLGMAMLSGQAAGMANQSCPSVLEPYFVLASTDSSSLSLELGTQVTILDSQACVQGVRVWLTSPSTTNGVATVSIWSPTGSLLFRSSSGQQQASGSYAWDFYSSSCVVGSSFTVSFSTTNTLLGYAAPISLPRSNSGFSVTASVFSDSLGQFPINQASLSHVHMVEPLVCSPPTPPSSSCPSALNSITFLNTDPNSLYQELGTTGQILATSPTACMSGIRIYLSVSSSTPGAVVSLWNAAGVLQWQSSNGSLVTPGGQIYEYLMPSCSRVVPLSTFTVSFHTVNSNTYGYAGDGGSYTPTPYFQITSSVAASSINMFPSGASGHYHMIEPIICGGTQASCPLNTDCNSCAKTSGCQWCLDSSTCTITNSTCQSYIQNPSFCPAPACSTYASCTTCTSASSSSCTWCLDSNSCVTRSTTCPDRISSPSFCPTSLLEFFEEPSKK